MPETQFKKACIIFLVLTMIYVVMTSSSMNNFNNNVRKHVFSKLFADSDADIEQEQEQEKEPSKFMKLFEKQDAKSFWISGNVKINTLTDYNNQSKEQIYKFRNYYVTKSIFRDRNYVPNAEVFGGIKDDSKWISTKAVACSSGSSRIYKGLSNESKFMNNPEVLVGVDYIGQSKKYIACTDDAYLNPANLSFAKDKNLFELTYRLPNDEKQRDFKLVGLNARDFGFNYVYCKRVNNIKFSNEMDNVATNVVEFKDSIRVDKSCGVSVGCNRNMAYQEELMFNLTTSPASLELSLWKEKPDSVNKTPDMNFTVIIE